MIQSKRCPNNRCGRIISDISFYCCRPCALSHGPEGFPKTGQIKHDEKCDLRFSDGARARAELACDALVAVLRNHVFDDPHTKEADLVREVASTLGMNVYYDADGSLAFIRGATERCCEECSEEFGLCDKHRYRNE